MRDWLSLMAISRSNRIQFKLFSTLRHEIVLRRIVALQPLMFTPVTPLTASDPVLSRTDSTLLQGILYPCEIHDAYPTQFCLQ